MGLDVSFFVEERKRAGMWDMNEPHLLGESVGLGLDVVDSTN